MQLHRLSTATLSCTEQFAVPQRLEAVPKRVHRAKQVEYTHTGASRSG
jgi:hypothetical protein